jgi:hypothetical protein
VSAPPEFEPARAVADAVLYEGYLLYPYRRSSGKNRVRWQFGVLVPHSWLPPEARDDTGVSGSADGWRQQTECLLEARDAATVHLRLRFLQLQHRSVQTGDFEEVDELTVGGQRYLTFDEAVPHERDLAATIGDLRTGQDIELTFPGGEDIENLDGGRVVRTRWPLRAAVRLSATTADAPFPLVKLRVVVENAAISPEIGAPREEALRVSLVATHTILGVRGGKFVSLLDPPEWAAIAAKSCRNVHTFPVLVGETTVLSSPIIMADHPRVSPESPGDLFDATEIDEILSLRTLALTDEEKQEARATDTRAAAIIDRVEGIPREVMARLHGAVRGLRPASVLVQGINVTKGSRVRLKPRPHGTDAHDVFLRDRVGVVQDVMQDVDDSWHVAVTLEQDPGADLHEWYGRFYYFAPDELAPLEAP